MTLRAAVWKTTYVRWVVDVCHAEDYRRGMPIWRRVPRRERWRTRHFRTHAEAIAYAHHITHKEQE